MNVDEATSELPTLKYTQILIWGVELKKFLSLTLLRYIKYMQLGYFPPKTIKKAFVNFEF